MWITKSFVALAIVALAACGANQTGAPGSLSPAIAKPDRGLTIQPPKLVFASTSSRSKVARVSEAGGTISDACTPNGIASIGSRSKKNTTFVSVAPMAPGHCVVYFLNLDGTAGGYLHVVVK